MHTDTKGLAATELHGDEARMAKAIALAGDLELVELEETEAQRNYRVLSAPSQPRRRSGDIAQTAELNGRITNSMGFWA